MNNTLYMVMFAVNLLFIATNLYGWLLKRFYVPTPFKEHYTELYPVHRLVATFCLLQLYELPYLFNIGDQVTLFYVNGMGIMFFSAFFFMMVKGYFFLDMFTWRRMVVFMHPMILCWIALLLPVMGVIEFTVTYQLVMFCVISVVSAMYVVFLVKFRNRLHRQILKIDESEYSNESDFPAQFAKRIEWLPLLISALLFACFVINHPIAKMVRDIILIGVCTWFVFYTLNPHRKAMPELTEAMEKEENSDNNHDEHPAKQYLTEKKRKEMQDKMMQMLVGEKLYLADHFAMSELVHRMGTNKRYLNEVISMSGYETFYHLINTLRIENACRILDENRHAKMENVALESGFSSGSAFSQVFKKIKGITPREYIEKMM